MEIFVDVKKKVYEVRITKSSKKTLWYSGLIGKKFLAVLHYRKALKTECWHVVSLSPKSKTKTFTRKFIRKGDVARSKKLIGTFTIRKLVSKII